MARRAKLTSALVEDGAAPVGHSLRSPAARSRALIITGQVAIASLLLVGAGLLSQSLYKLINIDHGYQPEAFCLSESRDPLTRRINAGVLPGRAHFS